MENVSSQFLTDFYQLTMAYGYWKAHRAETPALFNLYFRSNPFHGGYTVVAGLEPAMEWLEKFRFEEKDLAFLGGLKTPKGSPLFDPSFLDFLMQSRFECDVEALPEGTVAFPNEPILKVRGPMWQCQWIETGLLNIINFQSLIATKAARIVAAARGGEVMEIGLRRAQGVDGGVSASRAAYIGGVSGTSNLLAGMRFGIPLRGTVAHSWVMAFETEIEAFRKYADAMPENCALLVDTYDTLRGVEKAIKVGKELQKEGKKLLGVRLDSGDLAYLSHETRRMLDEAGLKETRIIASNELDEYLIQSLHLQGAKIDIWGVGTKLVTAQDQPAMSGVYKLVAVHENNRWEPKVKVSDQPLKTSNPGAQNIRRFFNSKGEMEGDLVYEEQEDPKLVDKLIDPIVSQRSKAISKEWTHRDLLQKIFLKGKKIYSPPSFDQIRAHAQQELSRLHSGHKRLENPHAYPVGLSPYLSKLKNDMIRQHVTEKDSP